MNTNKGLYIAFLRFSWVTIIFHWCVVQIEKYVMRVTDRHHEAYLVMPNSDPECFFF